MVMVESPHMEPHTHTHSGRESDSGGGREIEREKKRGMVDGDEGETSSRDDGGVDKNSERERERV